MPSDDHPLCCVCGQEAAAHALPVFYDTRERWCCEFRQDGDDVQSWLSQQPGTTTLGITRELLPALVQAGIPLTAPAHRWESDVRRVLVGRLGEKP